MANTSSRLLNTDSLVQWAEKLNQTMDRVDSIVSSSGSITGTPSTNNITVYDGNWTPYSVAGDVSITSLTTTANFSLSTTSITGKTEATSTNTENDYLLIYNSSAGALRKIKPKFAAFPAGSSGQVQYHGGATGFAGSSSLSFDPVTGTLSTSNAAIGSTGFSVNGKYLNLSGNLNTSGGYSITLGASGQTNVDLPSSGTLLSTATTSLPGVTTASNLTSTGTLNALTVAGAVTLQSGGALTVQSTSPTFSNNTTFNSGLYSKATITSDGAATFGSTVGATGAVTLKSTLNVVGVAGFGGNVGVGGTLGATGAVTFGSTLNVASTTGFGGNVGVGGTLGATGAVTFGSTLNVTGTSTLTNIGATGIIAFKNVFMHGGGLNVGATGAGSGEIRATGDITAYYSSDAKFKDNVTEIPDALEKIKSIRGVTFDWNDEYIKSHGGEDGYFIRKRDVGVIAQEIQKVLPELVVERSEGYLAVKYDRIVALLIQAVKELSDKLEERK
jgi:hypothetical protein